MTRVLIRSQREFRARSNRVAFNALITTPATGVFQMPAAGKILFVATVPTIEGDVIATVTGATVRTMKSPGSNAGLKITIDNIAKGCKVAASANVEVYLDRGLGVWSKIAEGV